MSLQYPVTLKLSDGQVPGIARWEGNIITCHPQDEPTMHVIFRGFYFHRFAYQEGYKELHAALNELVTAFVGGTGSLTSETTILELITWSADQSKPGSIVMNDEYSVIPALTIRSMKAYVEHHQPVGSFLQAVLSNDLKSAIGIADPYNFPALRKIVTWICCECPFAAQGTPEKYSAWIKDFNPGGAS